DMNPAQIHLVELKLAGIRHLEYEDFIALMGVASTGNPEEIYHSIRAHLSPEARDFWNHHIEDLRYGVYRCGRLDRYFRTFREEYLSELWEPDLIERLFGAPDLETQARRFEEEAFTTDFRERFRWYYGREKMAARGRDPAQFRYVEEAGVGDYFLSRFHDVCTRLPLEHNFYVERFLTGRYGDLMNGPLYLRPQNFEKLKGLIDRVKLVTEELETHLAAASPGTYSKANLSDVFEYMSQTASDHLFRLFAERIRGGGRIAYWNLLVERRPPPELRARLIALDEESNRLWLQDRSWFYRSFRLEEVHP
ncbi:MAG: DUF3419 family protein, partial [Bradymonadaceae bacterium]